jgi:aminobenzoyl-glutamate transport protein
MASFFVPMLMLIGRSPEVMQVTYGVGDSTTNVITPLLPYYPLDFSWISRFM